MIAIPNIEKPKQCIKELDCGLLDEPCLFIDERNACLLQEDSKIGEYEQNYKTCPLIEMDEEVFRHLKGCAFIIKALYKKLKEKHKCVEEDVDRGAYKVNKNELKKLLEEEA